MKRVELLAPAGNMDSLIAAIEAGCDALYLGGTLFGARKFAGNFTNEELLSAITYAHGYGVKVYVTVNTLIYENEVEEFIHYIEFLHRANVDAVIMQDIGMMDLVRKTFPNLSIHASTQMHIHNLEGTKLMESLGLERVVLARETSIDQIKEIKDKTNIELEIFIHGALCMSYSGQCLMSSLIGGRSSNRGTCTQCCRLPYDLISDGKKINKEQYLLSTKDLNTVTYIHQLLDLHVDSLKIEGRMKSPEYVYQVVKLYRTIIDAYYSKQEIAIEEEIKKLQVIFNRKFTKGFLFNEENNAFINTYRPNHMGIEIGQVVDYQNGYVSILLSESLNRLDGIRIVDKEDNGFIVSKMYKNKKEIESALKGDIISIKVDKKVSKNSSVLKTKDYKLIEEIHESIKKKQRKISLTGSLVAHKNQKLVLEVLFQGNSYTVEGDIVEESKNIATTEEEIRKQISKLGNTNFVFTSLKIEKDADIFIRVYSLNELRRQMVEKINEILQKKKPFVKRNYELTVKEYIEDNGFSVLIKTKEDYEFIKDKKVKTIYMPKDLYDVIEDERKVPIMKNIQFDYPNINESCLIGELGGIHYYQKGISDYSLNVVNSYSVAFLHSLGIERVTLSYELTDLQIEELIRGYQNRYHKKPNLELIVSSIPEVMVTKFNLLKYFHTTGKQNYLKDSNYHLFPLEEDSNTMRIKFYKKIQLKPYEKYFQLGIQTLRIHIEDKEDYNF